MLTKHNLTNYMTNYELKSMKVKATHNTLFIANVISYDIQSNYKEKKRIFH